MPSFDDDELEAFYRLVESRTADGDIPRGRHDSGGAGVPDAAVRDHPARDCPTPDKEPYSNTAAAAEAITRIASARRSPPLRSYRCRCGAWHITSSPPRQRLPRARHRRGRR